MASRKTEQLWTMGDKIITTNKQQQGTGRLRDACTEMVARLCSIPNCVNCWFGFGRLFYPPIHTIMIHSALFPLKNKIELTATTGVAKELSIFCCAVMQKEHRTIDHVEGPSRDHGQAKRQKVSDCLNNALLLNEIGIECHLCGKIEEARSSFQKALGKINAEDCGILFKTRRSECAGTKSKGHVLISQACRESEYDEGMHVYKMPLHLSNETKSRSTIASTLFYNIGLTCIRIKDFENAKLCFRKALEIYSSSNQGDNSTEGPDREKISHNLGYCCFSLGHMEASLEHYQESLDQANAAPGTEKVNVAVASNCVAMLKLRNKDCDSQHCMDLLRTSLDHYSGSFGHSSLEATTVMFNIAQAHFYRKEYPKALAAFKQSLTIRRKIVEDEKSIGLAVLIFGIGQTYHRLGCLDDALACFNKFLEFRPSIDVRMEDSVTVLAAMNSIAIICRDKGDLKQAQAIFEQALDLGLKVFDGYHINLAPTLINFGSLCFQLAKFDMALALCEQCLKVQKQDFATAHTEIINTLLNIAEVHWRAGSYRGAWSTFKEILTLQVQFMGASSLPVASTLSSMAFIYFQFGQNDDALELYQEALRIRRDNYEDQDHPDIVATLNTTGLVLCKLEEYKLAKESFEECIRSRVKKLGPNHVDLSILIHNLAAVHLDMGDDEDAIALFRVALSIRETQPDPDQSLIASTMYHLGQAYQINGRLELAVECFERGLQIERSGGNDIIVIRKLLNLIGNLKMMLASVDELMEAFVEASRLRRQDEKEDFLDFLFVTGHSFFDLSRLHPTCAPTA